MKVLLKVIEDLKDVNQTFRNVPVIYIHIYICIYIYIYIYICIYII